MKGAGFVTSDKVAVVMREGVVTKLVDAVMAALDSRIKCLSNEDVRILVGMYTAAPSAAMMTADAVMKPEGPNTLTE